MNLTKESGVLPPKFDDARLNRTLGSIFGKIADDEAQALVFRHAELQTALRIREAWKDMFRSLTNNVGPTIEHIELISTSEAWASVAEEALDFLLADQLQLEKERALAKMHLALSNKVVAALMDLLATPTMAEFYQRGAPRDRSPLTYLQSSADACDRARRRMDGSSEVWTKALETFVDEARRRNAYAKTADSVSIAIIDSYRGEVLEYGVARMLERDGCTVIRRHGGKNDQGADVIALTPTGLRVVLQCKHSTSPDTRIGPRFLFELNGTARPIHNADVVGIVTNRSLTPAAETFARMQGIHIVDRRGLQRWGTYGVPWYPLARQVTPTA